MCFCWRWGPRQKQCQFSHGAPQSGEAGNSNPSRKGQRSPSSYHTVPSQSHHHTLAQVRAGSATQSRSQLGPSRKGFHPSWFSWRSKHRTSFYYPPGKKSRCLRLCFELRVTTKATRRPKGPTKEIASICSSTTRAQAEGVTDCWDFSRP